MGQATFVSVYIYHKGNLTHKHMTVNSNASLKVIFFAVSVCKNQSKYCFLFSRHSILDCFLCADMAKKTTESIRILDRNLEFCYLIQNKFLDELILT